jgi:hypothetical protein
MATNLPKAVQRQLEQAQALEAQAQSDPQSQVVTDVAQLPTQPEAQPPAPAPAQAAPAPAPAPTETPAPTEDWHQKYRTLQGMFQRQVPELQTLVKSLESRLAASTDQIATLQTAVQKTAAATPAEPPTKAEIDPRDARAFGEDMVEMVNRYAQRTFQAAQQQINTLMGKFEKRLVALETAVTGVSQKTETTMETTFYATLDTLVPNWKTINASGEWLEWLAEVDDVYNVPRQTALDLAFERRDAARVAAVFKKFLATRPSQPKPTEKPPISPSEGGGATPPAAVPAAKPILSQKAVQAFYLDVSKGRYRGREEEAARIEADINLAAAEGRIV